MREDFPEVQQWEGRFVTSTMKWWAERAKADKLKMLHCIHGVGLNETCQACSRGENEFVPV